MLIFRGSVPVTSNLLIIMFVFIAYGLLGFADDFLKVTKKNNKGLSIREHTEENFASMLSFMGIGD